MEINEFIKKHEGLRLKPYKCSAGKVSIGYGRNLTDGGISNVEAEIMFEKDLSIAKQNVWEVFGKKIDAWTNAQYMAIVDMMFNLGKTKFLSFKKMIKAINCGDWLEAKKEALDSLWARQVGNRSKEVTNLFLGAKP